MTIVRAIIAVGMLALYYPGNVLPAFAATEPYVPSIIYPGPYEPEQLFYRNPKGFIWLRWSEAVFTKSVTCSGTIRSLKLTGIWQGHLKPNGACGTPAEPSYWALGNWINYDLINKRREAQ
ncbi:hypothetical protein KI811_02835 [Geobacter hydrogenophilus]|uniref:Uncharacterized protein n=1 Tax=Geobacter hydrogenophilus TaxID=40983 RepID=A0A9W6G1M3_9BACT|nr:hypothetical protein [Geobacter hydrogenophilus]MBT0892760.1 hypothetical protein [Geobacter hydrogenophilus]GLI38767.1 hypothetical protein GHYDROH2_22680 [Geobacter hydrogenophilus]